MAHTMSDAHDDASISVNLISLACCSISLSESATEVAASKALNVSVTTPTMSMAIHIRETSAVSISSPH